MCKRHVAAAGLFAKAWNAFYLEKVDARKRVIGNAIILAVGLVGVTFADRVNFWFLLVAISFIGSADAVPALRPVFSVANRRFCLCCRTASAFGESVVLGHLKNYPTALTGAFSSGTGGAGIGVRTLSRSPVCCFELSA